MHPASISSCTAASLSSWSPLRRAASRACSAAAATQAPLRRAAVPEHLLAVESVSMQFGGLLAVDQASFTATAGRITALIGPNGAGKTTLFATIGGFLRPTQGRVVYDGADVTGLPPHRLARRGMARTFQIAQPFAGLTVR